MVFVCSFYITPKSFLDMLALFSSMLGEQHTQLTTSRDRLVHGLNKLQETNSAVDGMQRELTALQPTLQYKTASAQQLLAQVLSSPSRALVFNQVPSKSQALCLAPPTFTY